MKPIPVVVLCGFLGSGKTTLLRRWRRDAALRDAVVIVHDLSDFGLDAELLSAEGSEPTPGRLQGRFAALHGRHAREELHDSVGRALDDICVLDPVPPLVLCESTGAARPWPLIRALTQDLRFTLRHFIVTVDALNLHRDFADGRVLTGDAPVPDDDALYRAAGVLAEQIAFASVVVLTKIDTLSRPTVDGQVRALQRLQPSAAVGLSAYGGLGLSKLDGTPAPDLPVLRDRARRLGLAWEGVTADEVGAAVLRDPRPFHPGRLFQACQEKLGTGLYRTKGFLWLASRPRDVLLWQQSGSQIALELTGTWRAALAENPDGTLRLEEVEGLKARLATAHPLFGDRHNELTLIGLERDRESFLAALHEALCTDREVEAWRAGEPFDDPWPTSLRRID